MRKVCALATLLLTIPNVVHACVVTPPILGVTTSGILYYGVLYPLTKIDILGNLGSVVSTIIIVIIMLTPIWNILLLATIGHFLDKKSHTTTSVIRPIKFSYKYLLPVIYTVLLAIASIDYFFTPGNCNDVIHNMPSVPSVNQ